MGLERAEARLLGAISSRPQDVALDVRVVGGRSARSYARRIGARWIPARPGTMPRRATVHADLIHLLALDLPPPRKARFVVMVHDLSPLHYDDEGQLPPWIDEIVEHAALVLTPSAFTASELQKHLGVPEQRIRIIGGAPSSRRGMPSRFPAENCATSASSRRSLFAMAVTRNERASSCSRRLGTRVPGHSRPGRAFSDGRGRSFRSPRRVIEWLFSTTYRMSCSRGSLAEQRP